MLSSSAAVSSAAGGGATRLDKLLALLSSSNSSEATRAATARQLGQIQREHPQQLHSLLQRVLPLLFHEIWETRRAAALALDEVCSAVPEWCPAHIDVADADAEAAARVDAEGAWLGFRGFDMGVVLRHGAPLLAR